MKNSIKVIAEEGWSWMLFQDDQRYILSVVCGSVALYSIDMLLSEMEATAYHQEGRAAIKKLAEKIRNNPEAYRLRHLTDFHTNAAAGIAAKEWRDNH
jgi:hypothetical protein